MSIAVDHIELRYRRADTVGSWTNVTLAPGQQAVNLTGSFQRGEVYQIEVRSVGVNGGVSAWVQATHTIAPVTIAPVTPSNFRAISLQTGVALAWTVGTAQAAGVSYEVQRTDDSAGVAEDADWFDIASVASTSYLDPVSDEVKYWYRVRATNYADISTPWSTPASGHSLPPSSGGGNGNQPLSQTNPNASL